MNSASDELKRLGATRCIGSDRGFGGYTVARIVGTVGLERVLLAIASLNSRTNLVRNEPLLRCSHDEMGGDRRDEGRNGDESGDSELHFDIDTIYDLWVKVSDFFWKVWGGGRFMEIENQSISR